MTDPTPPPATPARFPGWVIAGGLLLAAGYLPTLNAPFDFMDDGNLVYPTTGLTVGGHVQLWWRKVVANVEHLGPFRPAVWAHWQLAANLFADDPVAWRATRLGWCALAAVMLLWLMRELKLHPAAALMAAAAAMWNPYRNEIWTSLTLAEGVAMPYALFALVAARKAATSPRAWRWDVGAVLALLMALGCKNTFVALVPPMLLLRTWTDGQPWRTAVRRNGLRAAAYLLPVLLPAAHFVYFKLHWHPGYYQTPGPSWEQAGQFLLWLKGAAGVDFLAAGVLLTLVTLARHRHQSRGTAVPRLSILTALLLLGCGFIVYLPVNIMSGRYTMPAVWGVDVLLAVLLTRLIALPQTWPVRTAWAGVGVGLVAVVVAGANRQEKVQARSRALWDMLEHVERAVPPGASIAWVSGPTELGELNAEEGIHFYWHLLHRGRIDVRVGLVDLLGNPVERVELPPLTAPPQYRLAARPTADSPGWHTEHETRVRYRFGLRDYSCVLESRRADSPPALDPVAERLMRQVLGGYDPVKKLLGGPPDTRPGVAEALGKTADRPK
jgi:hypothetical protein